MIRVRIVEHGRLHRWHGRGELPAATEREAHLPSKVYDALQAMDLRRAEGPALAWSLDRASAGQWVGVIRSPGLELEVLPKIDGAADGSAGVRRNLLYMLGVAGLVPVRQVDLARLAHRKAPLTETLVRIFAHRLQTELLRGIDRRYVQRDDDLRTFKGKLLVGEQVRRFAAHRERFRCRFDEFSPDTPMNRVFRHVARLLVATTHAAPTGEALRRCLLLLDDVSDAQVGVQDVDGIVIDRKNERFEDILTFCRLVLSGRSPTSRTGDLTTYSLLFDMNQVFERFVANFIRRYVLPKVEGARFFPQGRHRRRALMRSSDGRAVLPLKPDLLFDIAGTHLVIDTKWKQVGDGQRTRASGADLYQLFAYTKRYAAPRSILLYPHHAEFRDELLDVLDGANVGGSERVELRSVNLSGDLWSPATRALLAHELKVLIEPAGSSSGLDMPTALP